MKILKLIFVFLVFYFIRRFIQMYRVMKAIQERQVSEGRSRGPNPQRQDSGAAKVVNADFKIID